MIDKSFVEKIEAMTAPTLTVIDGKQYSTKELHRVIDDPRPEPLKVSTLSGLVEYLKENKDNLDSDNIMIIVDSPNRVRCVSTASGPRMARTTHIIAEHPEERNGEISPTTAEQFVVQCMSGFVQTEDMKMVLKIAGNLRQESVKTIEDDGVTQQAAVRQGITKVANVEIKNPVMLAPFRTFREIDQPVSPFIFRLKNGSEITCALYEVDRITWKLDAVKQIKCYLEERLKDVIVIS